MGGWGLGALSSELRLDGLPEPKPEELELLKARRSPQPGTHVWRLTTADGRHLDVSLRAGEGRIELRTPEMIVRTQGESAALAYPNLALVELGNWGEAARQSMDAWLPWLPHRSSKEIARWFDVQATPDKPADDTAAWLRLFPQGAPESAGLWIDMEISRQDGLVTQWESYRDGKLSGRIRFRDRVERQGSADWKTIVLEDVSGKERARWELQDLLRSDDAVPELASAWEGFVLLDRRSNRPATDTVLREVLEAIRKHEISQAMDRLDDALQRQPDHPLLLLLRAWCRHLDPDAGNPETMFADLRKVAASPAVGLTRFIARDAFPELSPQALYDILLAQDASLRRPADWDHLAQAAAAAGRLAEALEHAEAALAAKEDGSRPFDRHKIRVELLLRLRRVDEAEKAAETWGAQAGPSVEELAQMAELLSSHHARSPAIAMLDRALAQDNLPPGRRHDLLLRKASLSDGLARWRLLVQAAEIESADSHPPQRTLDTLLAELHRPQQAEIAATLAAETNDPQLQTALRIRQAELTADAKAAGDLAWEIYRSRRLKDDRLAWACEIGRAHV
jgi:tetratricopeptide (TPR) repeat protein